MKKSQKIVFGAGAVFFGSLLIFTILINRSWNKLETGYETDVMKSGPYLKGQLATDLGYSELQSDWVKSSWANGFQDHTRLYCVQAEESARASLWSHLSSKCEEQGTGFPKQGQYLGPSSAPPWWDVAALDSAPSLYCRTGGTMWRFTQLGGSIYIVLLDF